MNVSAMSHAGQESPPLRFDEAVTVRFAFLGNLGYRMAEAVPTRVRYIGGPIEIDIYHGRHSMEIGLDIVRNGTRYSLSEIVRLADVDEGERYRNFVATTPGGIEKGLAIVEGLLKRHGDAAMRGDAGCFAALDSAKASWGHEFALDVLETQLRPKAEEAFRNGQFDRAAELFEKIRPRLTPSEVKKLELATQRIANK